MQLFFIGSRPENRTFVLGKGTEEEEKERVCPLLREIQAKCHRGNTRYILTDIYYPSSAINVAYSYLLLPRQFW